MIKKTLALICILCCICIGIQAETKKSLVIQKSDGSLTSFMLSELPELTFDNRSIIISIGGQSTSFQIEDVVQYYFEEVSDNTIREIKQKYTISNDVICIGDIIPQNQVRLVSVDGKIYPSHISITEGQTIISLASLPKGVYIIQIKNKQIKVIKK